MTWLVFDCIAHYINQGLCCSKEVQMTKVSLALFCHIYLQKNEKTNIFVLGEYQFFNVIITSPFFDLHIFAQFFYQP